MGRSSLMRPGTGLQATAWDRALCPDHPGAPTWPASGPRLLPSIPGHCRGRLPAWAQHWFRGSSKAAVVTKITEGCHVSPLPLPGPNSPSCHAYHLPTDAIPPRPHCQGAHRLTSWPPPLQDRGHAEGSRSGPPTGLFHSPPSPSPRLRHTAAIKHRMLPLHQAGILTSCQGGDGPRRISVLNLIPPCRTGPNR